MLELQTQAAFSVIVSVDNETVSISSLKIFTISFNSFSNDLPWFPLAAVISNTKKLYNLVERYM